MWTDEHASFRVTEDRTLADVRDRAYQIDGGVRIAHPLDLAGSTQDWSALFADYEIIQPFPQLAETAYGRERSLAGFRGLVVPWHRMQMLRDFVACGGQTIFAYTRDMPFGVSVTVTMSPGISRVDPRASGDQSVIEVTSSVAEGDVGAVAFSEMVRAVAHVRVNAKQEVRGVRACRDGPPSYRRLSREWRYPRERRDGRSAAPRDRTL